MNLACRREAEHPEPGPATKFRSQILASCGSHKGGKACLPSSKKTFYSIFYSPGSHLVGVHLFDFRFVGYTHPRRESDDLRFEFLLTFVLGHEFQDTFVNEVLNGAAGKIREFSQFSHSTLVELS